MIIFLSATWAVILPRPALMAALVRLLKIKILRHFIRQATLWHFIAEQLVQLSQSVSDEVHILLLVSAFFRGTLASGLRMNNPLLRQLQRNPRGELLLLELTLHRSNKLAEAVEHLAGFRVVPDHGLITLSLDNRYMGMHETGTLTTIPGHLVI